MKSLVLLDHESNISALREFSPWETECWRVGKGVSLKDKLPIFQLCCLPAVPLGFPDGSVHEESACHAGDSGDTGSIPGLGRSPGGGKWQPTPVFLPGKFHGQRILVGYSPKGRKRVRCNWVTDHAQLFLWAKFSAYLWLGFPLCIRDK